MESKENSVKTPKEVENDSVKTLTEAEEKVVEFLSRGLSEKEIGAILKMKPSTVNSHTSNIRKKLGLNKNTEVILSYIAKRNKKPFDIKAIREYGVTIILVMINVCLFNK